MLESQLQIGGDWIDGAGETLESTCPVDDSVIWSGRTATPSQVDAAFAAARTAFGPWWDLSVESRIEIAEAYRDNVKASSEELALLIARETGKPIWESKTEAGAVAAKIDLSIDAFRNRRDTTQFEIAGALAVTRYKPHGVCGVLGPFNFPAHLANGHIVPALITGNVCVFKPSEMTPAVGQWMVMKWLESGLPPGVLNLVQGGRDVGEAIASHTELDGLFFTGSSAAGKALHKTLAPFPQKILALEMGGNNPLIVHDINDFTAAAYLTVLSAYMTAGQRCTCARRLILIDDAEGHKFLSTLEDMIGRVTFGFYDDEPQPFMGSLISSAAGKRLLSAQAELISRGAQPIIEMQSQRNCGALISPGLLDVTQVDNLGDEELFGPLLNLRWVKNFDEAIEEANRTDYGLSAGLLSDNEQNYRQFIHQIRAGIVNWNRQTTGASGKLPFGGCGLSGNHRPSAYFAVDYCSYPVASIESQKLSMPEKPLTGIGL